MPRRFVAVTLALVAVIAFLLGLIADGTTRVAPAPPAAIEARVADRRSAPQAFPAIDPTARTTPPPFADIAAIVNPAVVTVDASAIDGRSRRAPSLDLDSRNEPFDPDLQPGPRRGAGTGFVIDPAGLILTNHHVIEGADRVVIRLADGRTVRATIVGSDPDTDIALLSVEAPSLLPSVTLGDSDAVRVGEWVLAIGNPLAYEHTVTVGVVSFIGRKLFDASLDRYIQTDAAISFGNSGGPLVNGRGEVIGINAAVSSRAAGIGFAIPINQAVAILPQLREAGRVSRGYIGVALRDVDAGLQRSLGLPSSAGALVQDVTPGSPGDRAGVRPYDLIVAIDGLEVEGNDALIQLVAERAPGSTASLHIVRDGRPMALPVKLAERPLRGQAPARPDQERSSRRGTSTLGLSVQPLEAVSSRRFTLPAGLEGVVVTRVDAVGPGADAGIERGHVILEVNRRSVRSVEDFGRIVGAARAGDVLAFYLFRPETGRRELRAVTAD